LAAEGDQNLIQHDFLEDLEAGVGQIVGKPARVPAGRSTSSPLRFFQGSAQPLKVQRRGPVVKSRDPTAWFAFCEWTVIGCRDRHRAAKRFSIAHEARASATGDSVCWSVIFDYEKLRSGEMIIARQKPHSKELTWESTKRCWIIDFEHFRHGLL